MFKTDGGGGATGPDRTLDCLTFWLRPAETGDRQLELEQTQNIRDLQSKTLFAFAFRISHLRGLQSRTNKHDKFDISWPRISRQKLTSDSDSGRQNTSKKLCPKFFPRGFWAAKILSENIRDVTRTWAQWSTASMCIMANREHVRCPFCFRTAHAAALPFKPNRYALIKRQAWFINRRMTSIGQESRAPIAAFFASCSALLGSPPTT